MSKELIEELEGTASPEEKIPQIEATTEEIGLSSGAAVVSGLEIPTADVDELISPSPPLKKKSNASRASTRTGWEIYKASDAKISYEDLCVELEDRSLDPISEKRTYRQHYGGMWKTGYRGKYVPLNTFDVLRKSGMWPPR